MNNTEANRHNTFQTRVKNRVLYTTTNLLGGLKYHIAMKHDELNAEREGEGVRGFR